MIDKFQDIYSYVSGYGITVYSAKQYNTNCNTWYVVGDTCENKALILNEIKLHNLKLKGGDCYD